MLPSLCSSQLSPHLRMLCWIIWFSLPHTHSGYLTLSPSLPPSSHSLPDVLAPAVSAPDESNSTDTTGQNAASTDCHYIFYGCIRCQFFVSRLVFLLAPAIAFAVRTSCMHCRPGVDSAAEWRADVNKWLERFGFNRSGKNKRGDAREVRGMLFFIRY